MNPFQRTRIVSKAFPFAHFSEVQVWLDEISESTLGCAISEVVPFTSNGEACVAVFVQTVVAIDRREDQRAE